MKILNTRVDNVDDEATLRVVADLIKEDRQGLVVTLNPEMVMLAQRDSQFAQILRESVLNVPDGMALLWAAWWLGDPIKHRVTGVDLIPKLAALAASKKWRIFLLGASGQVAEKTARRLESAFKGVHIAYSNADPNQALEKLRNFKGEIVLVAYGHGKQEKWIMENMGKIKANAFIGVGGALDYLSGSKQRAPLWIRQLGFEWFYRLMSEPGRLKRQLVLPEFVIKVLASKFS